MKNIFVILIILAIFRPSSSQVSKYGHANSTMTERSFIISGAPSILFDTPNGRQFAGGLKCQFFLGSRFSADWDVVISSDYAHLSIGLILGPLCLIFSQNSLVAFATGLALSLDHFSYHIPVCNDFDISPYLCLLRYKFANRHGNYSDPAFSGEQFCFATGLQFDKYFGRFVFSPYAEYYVGYDDHKSGYNIGVSLGIVFMNNYHKGR